MHPVSRTAECIVVSFADKVKELTGGVNACVEATGLGIGLIQALDCMKKMGRIALLGCTRNSNFSIDYYSKVHGKGVSLIGAHTLARPKFESSPGLWTDVDDLKATAALIKGGRLNFKDMICEYVSPADCQAVYYRLVNDKNFPIGVLFDWSLIDCDKWQFSLSGIIMANSKRAKQWEMHVNLNETSVIAAGSESIGEF